RDDGQLGGRLDLEILRASHREARIRVVILLEDVLDHLDERIALRFVVIGRPGDAVADDGLLADPLRAHGLRVLLGSRPRPAGQEGAGADRPPRREQVPPGVTRRITGHDRSSWSTVVASAERQVSRTTSAAPRPLRSPDL